MLKIFLTITEDKNTFSFASMHKSFQKSDGIDCNVQDRALYVLFL